MKSPQSTLSCAQFIRAVVTAAQSAKRRRSSPARRRALARWLVARYVPSHRVFGFDIRRAIIGRPLPSAANTQSPGLAPGFRHSLIAGGQNGEVIRHLGAAAASVLVGRQYLVAAADVVDALQTATGSKRREAMAEIAGNHAGLALGRCLIAYLDDECSATALGRRLRELLGRRRRPRTPRTSRRPTAKPSPAGHRRRSRAI